MAVSRVHRSEGARWRGRLAIIVTAPTLHNSGRPHAAGVPPARAHCSEGARWGVRLAPVVSAPARHTVRGVPWVIFPLPVADWRVSRYPGGWGEWYGGRLGAARSKSEKRAGHT